MKSLRIKDFDLRSRLFVGTGKYASYELMQQALEASGCQAVTVAVRRERLIDAQAARAGAEQSRDRTQSPAAPQ